jgi:hypothetical protein
MKQALEKKTNIIENEFLTKFNGARVDPLANKTKEELEAMGYIIETCYTKSVFSKEEEDDMKECLLKVERGEWNDEDYRDNVQKKYKIGKYKIQNKQ